MPIGAIGSYLIGLAARTRFAIAAAAALGVATTDGCYALLAGLGIAGIERVVGLVSGPLHVIAALLLVGLAVRTVVLAVRRAGPGPDPSTSSGHEGAGGPSTSSGREASVLRTYLTMIGLTAINPSTIATFAAIVGGHRLTGSPLWAAAAVFAVAAFLASAAWQLLLVGGGSVLGRLLSGRRGQLVVACASAGLMIGLAVLILLG
jgi:threonine/homoserine/homoserine lactone efflux protein